MRFWMIMVFSLMVVSANTACNTIEGLGEDVEAAGKKLESESEKNRNY